MSSLARWFDAVHPGVYVIAEAGVNHDGSVDDAHRLVDAAADHGADAVKFQTFDPAALTSARGPAASYQTARTGARTQRELLEAYVLPEPVWPELQAHARERGLDFLSTPFDQASLRLVCRLGVPGIKLGSGELTNRTLVQAAARPGLPVLLSTGMGRLDEVARAVTWLQTAGATRIALFHCVSSYPAPVDQANLRAIPAMATEFGIPVGWSDHTIGPTTAVVAVALGARLVEKHLTLDSGRAGPDHAASADPAAFGTYVSAVRQALVALGDGIKQPAGAEAENLPVVRRSWYAVRDLPAGTVLREADLVALRPEAGISAAADLVGATLDREVRAEAVITAEDLPSLPPAPSSFVAR